MHSEEVEHMQREQSHSPDVVERIGIVIWKIAVLLIALRCTLALIPQQGVLDGLRVGGMLLQGGALVLMTAGAGWAVIRALRLPALWLARRGSAPGRRVVTRPIRDPRASPALTAAYGLHHMMWRGANWMLALGLESMLAAQIIQLSIASAGQPELSWWRMSLVVIIAIGRILM
jgi:hypothetical protein